jgi:exodeoxyribonuclease VII small subunit
MSQDEAPRFEEALGRLEQIVQSLEKGDLSLEDSLKLYEDGIRLARLCHAKLEEAEGRIEMLVKDARGDVVLDGQGRPKTRPAPRTEDDETPRSGT